MSASIAAARARPSLAATLELLKPVTWFAPVWAFACGAVAGGGRHAEALAAGALLAGPLACASSQAVNDWFDRDVDAINEPGRPIPSGRVPGRWGLGLAIGWTALAALFAATLGPYVAAAAALGLLLSWAYSAPPVRLKRNGWLGNLAVGFSYEGLPWFAGTSICLRAMPPLPGILAAVLYSLGAHGIMVLNDFKSVEGDLRMGVATLPVRLGVGHAARLACATILAAQLGVLGLLLWLHAPLYACGIAVLMAGQIALMPRLLADPRRHAPWFNGSGTLLYVAGMMLTAVALAP